MKFPPRGDILADPHIRYRYYVLYDIIEEMFLNSKVDYVVDYVFGCDLDKAFIFTDEDVDILLDLVDSTIPIISDKHNGICRRYLDIGATRIDRSTKALIHFSNHIINNDSLYIISPIIFGTEDELDVRKGMSVEFDSKKSLVMTSKGVLR